MQQQDVPFPHWRVWKAATVLETNGMTTTLPSDCVRYRTTLKQVVAILRSWGYAFAGQAEWQSLLNKPSLLHEAEESIVALHHLHEWLVQRSNNEEPLIVVDVCAGKGLFGMLLSYMMKDFWKNDATITRIVMLDKMTSKECRWNHVHAANETALDEKRPFLQLWEGCNLHDYDNVLSHLYELDSTLALVGIHLCKTLGPSCVGLANGLGSEKCPFLCLAPCCMPRLVTTKKATSRNIPVNLYESPSARKNRLEAMKRRKVAMGKGSTHGCCYVCSQQHRVRDCPNLPQDREERIAMIQQAVARSPCWKCGEIGHFIADCTAKVNRPLRVDPPCVTMNVDGLLKQEQPFDTYCQLIADTVQDCSNKQVLETGLTNESSSHQQNNWNSNRKSIYIVASR